MDLDIWIRSRTAPMQNDNKQVFPPTLMSKRGMQVCTVLSVPSPRASRATPRPSYAARRAAAIAASTAPRLPDDLPPLVLIPTESLEPQPAPVSPIGERPVMRSPSVLQSLPAQLPPVRQEVLPTQRTLSKEEFAEENPHCRQILTDVISKYNPSTTYSPLYELRQNITPETPRVAYVRRDDRHRSLYYNGPLKLLLGDLNFLNLWTNASYGTAYTIVYAGAAPGHHISRLASLFPACTFILYDVHAFAANLPKNVVAHQEFFTSDVAATLAKEHRNAVSSTEKSSILFISNIRTCRTSDYSAADMDRQREWVRILQPEVSMLKFGLPWGAGRTKYLDGTLVFQPFSSQASTVCRLISRREQIEGAEKEYDNLEYEEQLAYHNMIGRVRGYDHGIQFVGLDHCHDCSAFVAISRGYIQRAFRSQGTTLTNDTEAVQRFLSETLSSILSSQYSRSRNVESFASVTPRSDARQWRT